MGSACLFRDTRLSASCERQARLGRFQGASAISSADYYGDGEARPGGGGGGGSGRSDFDMSANDLMNKLSFQVRSCAGRECGWH